MAATLDKDTLAKHGFWILAGCYVLLVLASLTVLAMNVSDTVRKEEEELRKAEDSVKGIKDPKNDQVVQAYRKQDEYVNGKKDEVWSKAWDTQKDMMTWPRALQANFQKYKYFGEPMNSLDDRNDFDQNYATQFEDVWKVLQPVTPKGEGAVQCRGDWRDVLQLYKSFDKKPPSKDDIWLAQEDLWIKREMLRVIRDANDSVARFKEVTAESSTPKEKQAAKAETPADKDGKPAKAEAAATGPDEKKVKPAAAAARTDS